MENLNDYSYYVNAAYLFTTVVLGGFLVVTLLRYYRVKSKLKAKEAGVTK